MPTFSYDGASQNEIRAVIRITTASWMLLPGGQENPLACDISFYDLITLTGMAGAAQRDRS